MPLKFTYHAQSYAQKQELWSGYYDIYLQVCMNNLLHVVNNFRKTVLLECIYHNDIKIIVCYALS